MIYNFIINFNITKLYIRVLVPSIIILFAVVFLVIYISNNNSFKEDENIRAEEILEFCETDVDNCFNNYFIIAQNYNNIFRNMDVISNSYKRNYYNSVTKNIVDKNTHYISALWADFDENKLDNLDAQYVNTEYYSEKGRFNVCWYITNARRRKSNFQKYSSIQQKTSLLQPYMSLPRTTKRVVITEPIIDANSSNIDKNNIIFTFSIPVFDKDSNVIGVTGLDVSVDNILSTLDKNKTNLVRMFSLVSNKGIYYAHPNADFIGKSIDYNVLYTNYNKDSILKEFAKNKNVRLDSIVDKKDESLVIINYHPIKIKGFDNAILYVGITLEHNTITVNYWAFFIEVLQYCMIVLLIIIIFIIALAFALKDMLSNKIYAKIDKITTKHTEKKAILDRYFSNINK
jgi:hypothetical protein